MKHIFTGALITWIVLTEIQLLRDDIYIQEIKENISHINAVTFGESRCQK